MFLTVFFCAATFFNVEELVEMLGLVMLFKIALALVALLHLKRTQPDTPRSIKVRQYILIRHQARDVPKMLTTLHCLRAKK